jgi:hypothetical protein
MKHLYKKQNRQKQGIKGQIMHNSPKKVAKKVERKKLKMSINNKT